MDRNKIRELLSAEKDSLFSMAVKKREPYYGKRVFLRGLIEFTNHCKNDCYYCGIRRSNIKVSRYRLTTAQILSACDVGFSSGIKTFVLQGGDDPYYTDERITELIYEIKTRYPQCALTLSIGERSRDSYAAFRRAGADRYLLRHETATKAHYERLHPKEMSFDRRMECLIALKEAGFQTGAGMMIGSPYQTDEELENDLIFLSEFKPHMIGIGPFMPHKDTPFKDFPQGSIEKTLCVIALARILVPSALIPATTALSSAVKGGLGLGLRAGANVVMPNLTPMEQRVHYNLYDNKIVRGAETIEGINALIKEIEGYSYHVDLGRGDW